MFGYLEYHGYSECSAAIQDYKGVTVKDEGTLERGKQTAFEDGIKS